MNNYVGIPAEPKDIEKLMLYDMLHTKAVEVAELSVKIADKDRLIAGLYNLLLQDHKAHLNIPEGITPTVQNGTIMIPLGEQT
jgi:hypothetical protein